MRKKIRLKWVCSLVWPLLALGAPLPAQERFPDGKKVPAWFHHSGKVSLGPRVGYVRRDQGHGISAIDWHWMLDFADNVWKGQE